MIQDFDKFISKKGDAQEIYACLAPESKVFFQYLCEQTSTQIEDKVKDARRLLTIELVCLAIVILFILFVKHRTRVLAKRYIKNHVQVMDYTMFFPIKQSQLKEFDQEHYKPNSAESRGMQLKKYVIEHLGELTRNVMLKEASQSNEDPPDLDKNAQITRVDLVFDNNNLLNILKKRGRAIMYEDKNEV